jgi:CheY-like chemotaxis protein
MLLVVENESISRYAFRRLLTKEGYEVMEAADGVEALNMLKTHRFDLVITALAMPQINGLTFVDRIRLEWPHTLILLVSAYLSRQGAKAILGEQVEFLTKPIDYTQLVATVNRLLPRSSNLQLVSPEP